jgi:hypothetical protein
MKPIILLAFYTILSASFTQTNDTVFICKGPKSNAYHTKSTCRGLNKCSSAIFEVSIKAAINMHRKPCKICKPPVVLNYKPIETYDKTKHYTYHF